MVISKSIKAVSIGSRYFVIDFGNFNKLGPLKSVENFVNVLVNMMLFNNLIILQL